MPYPDTIKCLGRPLTDEEALILMDLGVKGVPASTALEDAIRESFNTRPPWEWFEVNGDPKRSAFFRAWSDDILAASFNLKAAQTASKDQDADVQANLVRLRKAYQEGVELGLWKPLSEEPPAHLRHLTGDRQPSPIPAPPDPVASRSPPEEGSGMSGGSGLCSFLLLVLVAVVLGVGFASGWRLPLK